MGGVAKSNQAGQCHPQEALRTGGLLGLAEKATVKVGVFRVGEQARKYAAGTPGVASRGLRVSLQ